MNVAIAGAHGKVAQRLTRLLAARGDNVVGLIRNPDPAGDVRAAGGSPVVCDLERATAEEVATAIGDRLRGLRGGRRARQRSRRAS